MAKLQISLNQFSQIEIRPKGEISAEDWMIVINWWKRNGLSSVHTSIEVSVPEFLHKINWLRESWTRSGHEVEFSESAKNAIKESKNLIDEFERLAQKENFDTPIDQNFLKLKRPLTNFQISNLKALISMPNGANFSVPGAGKTSTTLAVWDYFRNQNKISQLLVICPRSAFEAWKDEPRVVLATKVNIFQFSDESIPPEADIIYVNYEQLENQERLLRLMKWIANEPTMLVIDEAHRIKSGAASVRWRACLELSSKATRVDLLTGTPMPQSPEDLKNLLGISWPGIPKNFYTDQKLSKLRRGGIFVRTTKKELCLPPLMINVDKCPMGPIQQEIYSALRRAFVGRFGLSDHDKGYFGQKGKAVMSLIAAASNPGLLMSSISEDAYLGLLWPPLELSGSEKLMNILSNYSIHEIPSKYVWISKFVAKAAKEDRKVLIWSTFVGNLIALNKLLRPYNPAMIYGATSQDDRVSELARFRKSKDCYVLLSNPQTLGEGVSLHNECHDAIYLDRSYNAGLYLQSLDRIHRLGLKSDQKTNIYVLETNGSIDSRIAKRLEVKIERLGAYLNDDGLVEVSLPTSDDETIPDGLLGIDELDVNDLFNHLRIQND